MQFFFKILLLLIIIVIGNSAFAGWIKESDKNTLVVLRSQAKFSPEGFARLGLAEFDSEIMDLTAGVFNRRQADNQRLLLEMNKRLEAEENPAVRHDLQILIHSLDDELVTAGLHRDMLLPYYNVHQSLYYSFNSLLDPRNDRERYIQGLARLRKYTGQEVGYRPITELAIERTRERFEVPGLLGPYRGALETDLSSAPHLIAGIRALFEASGLENWEVDFSLLEEQLYGYQAWIEDELLSRARQDNQLPEEIYTDNLKNFGVRASPDELIATGQYAYQFIRSEMKALARQIARQRGWGEQQLVAVMRKLKAQQIPQDRILAIYKQRLSTIEDIIRREDIVTMPKRNASIRLATEAESAAIPAPFMSPPQLVNNSGQYGEFVLVQTNPALKGDSVMDDWSHDAIAWALTIHEARPGHELQFASLVENGTSLARAIYAFNSANTEGWGLYAESIMHEYLPLEAQLFNLYLRILRAARMYLDPMVNTGQLTPQQAEDFLVEQLAMSRPMASSEAERYAFRLPGQATAYYYGYMSLMRLRTELEITLGSDFNQREFHDFILRQGLLPPELMRDAVLKKFAVPGNMGTMPGRVKTGEGS